MSYRRSLVQSEIENANSDRKRMIQSITVCIGNYRPKDRNIVMIGALLPNCSPKFQDSTDDLIHEISNFTEDENNQFWSFIIEEVDKLKDTE
jgi:hypothetical protein